MNKENPQLVRGQSEDIEKREMFSSMRKRLSNYRELNEEIDNEIERLDRMTDRAYSVSIPVLSSMPKSPSSTYDRMADVAARIADLRTEIDGLIVERDTERKAIETLVKKLEKSGERAVIRSRYLDHEEWDDVQFVLFGNKPDYNIKYDEYKQRMFRWHRSAISNLASLSL